MPARLTAYLPEGAAVETLLAAGRGLQVGRAPPSELLIDHPSVSRSHACFEPEGEGWRLLDLDSKNGSFIDGQPANGRLLPANAWLRFGDVTCELAHVDEQALARSGERRAARQTASVLHQRAIEQSQGAGDLLKATLAAVIDLADCERGFLLINQPNGPVVRAWPMVAGIDGAGTVLSSSHPDWKAGDHFIHNGWGLGETRWGLMAACPSSLPPACRGVVCPPP